jgi:hypothetical protein
MEFAVTRVRPEKRSMSKAKSSTFAALNFEIPPVGEGVRATVKTVKRAASKRQTAAPKPPQAEEKRLEPILRFSGSHSCPPILSPT